MERNDMTCKRCKDKGWFHIDEVQAHETIREFYACDCDAGKTAKVPDDFTLEFHDCRLSWEERHDTVTMRDDF
jgi:hypothetical protein